MKTILLLIHDDEGQESRLQAALDTVRALNGHLRCLDVSILPAMFAAYDGGMAEAQLLTAEQERETHNKGRLEARLALENVSWDWVDVCGQLPASILEAANLCDLIVVSRRLDDFPLPDMLRAVSELIVKSATPVLAVPPASRGFLPTGRALIAWNGSASAIAAMRAALPLLRLASQVTLREYSDGTILVPAEDAATWLSREGVHAEIKREAFVSDLVADRLCAETRSRRIDYMVVGGFGHSRLREAVFGGVTRRLLSESEVPLLMAH